MKPVAVRIMLRSGISLGTLVEAEDRIRVACGAVMHRPLKEILAGASVVEVDRVDIKIAVDTADGLHALFDHFDIEDGSSQRPLLWTLLREQGIKK